MRSAPKTSAFAPVLSPRRGNFTVYFPHGTTGPSHSLLILGPPPSPRFVNSVTAHTSASRRSGDAPPDWPSRPQFLKAGDVVTLGIDGLGEQRQKIVAFKK